MRVRQCAKGSKLHSYITSPEKTFRERSVQNIKFFVSVCGGEGEV